MVELDIIKQVSNIIDSFNLNRVICVPHIDADIDAIASCYIMNQIFGIKIGLLNNPLYGALNFINLFNMEIVESFNESDYDLIIFVDGCELIQFNNIQPRNAIIIDHHLDPTNRPISNVLFSYIKSKSEFISCTSLILYLLKSKNYPISKRISSAVIAGFISDGGWVRATSEVRKSIEEIIPISEFSLGELSKLNKKKLITNYSQIEDKIKTLVALDLYTQDDISIIFVKASNRSDFFYISDNLLFYLNIHIYVSAVEEKGSNVIRIEEIRDEVYEKIDIPLWFNELTNIIKYKYIRLEYGTFCTDEKWEIIKDKMKHSLFAKRNRK